MSVLGVFSLPHVLVEEAGFHFAASHFVVFEGRCEVFRTSSPDALRRRPNNICQFPLYLSPRVYPGRTA